MVLTLLASDGVPPVRLMANAIAVLTFVILAAAPLEGAQWHVVVGGSGSGSATAPFGRIQDALSVAQPGDVVLVGPGTFTGAVQSVRAGSASQPITVRAANGRGSTLVTAVGRVLTVNHAYITVEGLVLDGQYGASDLVRVSSAGTGFTLRDSEVRRTSRDAIDMGAVHDVLIENSLIHHALNSADGRTDAHGVVGGAVQRLTVRNTEIHTFSGDAIQVDPGRAAPGWSDVTIEGCRFWLAPLPGPENGFAAGVITGENALDTKADPSYPRARVTIRNTEAWGFRGSTFMNNMAAFNLKEHIDATLDRVTVYGSEIAFRLRGPAWVRVQNAVVHDVDVAFRYEDDIQNLRIWNNTVGSGVGQVFRAASSTASGLTVRNLLVFASTLPGEASHASNRAVGAGAFVNPAAHDYRLAPGSDGIDAGVTIAEVTTDRDGVSRPQGPAYDIGAFERAVGAPKPPAAPANVRIVK